MMYELFQRSDGSLLKITGFLIVFWGFLDLGSSWLGVNLYYEIGINISQQIYSFTHWIAFAVGGVLSWVSRLPVQSIDLKMEAWEKENVWFGDSGDKDMTAYALSLHETALRDGWKMGSDEYFAYIDHGMRDRFPNFDWLDNRTSRKNDNSPRK